MKQQRIEWERHVDVQEKLEEWNADDWRAVTISGDKYLVYVLLEKEVEEPPSVTSTEITRDEVHLYGRAVKDLPPDVKVTVVEAMGFTRMHDDHQSECPYAVSEGNRCSCVMPADVYTMPMDVAKHLKQDYESLREASKKHRPIPEVER